MSSPRLCALMASVLLSAGLAPADGGAAVSAREPSAPADPAAILAYRASGDWDRDATAMTESASRHIAQAVRAGTPHPMLVLDVDDTALSSFDCLAARGFRRSGACARSGRLPAVPQTLVLYRLARERGVAVAFITGRREALRRVTAANLVRAGYDGRLQVRLRPDRERPGRHDGFKARQRRALERRGYTIVANVGDQRSDLRDGAAQRTFKLPNPMYLIPTA